MDAQKVVLSPNFILNDDWTTKKPILPESGLLMVTAEQERLMRAIRIEVAEYASTEKVAYDSEFEYFKSELGMNIILPKGRIEELRFKITLKGDGKIGKGVYGVHAIDGFPNDQIDQDCIVSGKVSLGVNDLLKLVPLLASATNPMAIIAASVGKAAKDLVKVDIEPWKINLGYYEDVKVDFSGGKTVTPECYFKGKGIQHDLTVAITIKKPIGIKKIDGDIQAAWIYSPGDPIWPEKTFGSAPKTVTIYGG